MCEVLNCQPNDLLESLPVSNQPQNPGDIRSVLRDWWHRVFPTNRPLGGKEIDSIVVTLRNCVENKSNEEIASIFRPDDDLELRFKFLISDFESSQSVQYETECFSGESIHDDPDICSCIFCYLRTKNNEFLSNFGNIRLRRFVRDSSSQSGSPSYLTHALASSDLTN